MKDTVYLVSNEPTPYKFSFDEKSCHCDGHSGQLVVEPMTGTIQPNTKYVFIHTCIVGALYKPLIHVASFWQCTLNRHVIVSKHNN